MDRQRRKAWTEVRALIRRAPAEYLLVKPPATPTEVWEFPGGKLPPQSDPERALRQWCLTNLGLEMVELAGQPPFDYRSGTQLVTYRYCHGSAARDEALPLGVVDLRWVSLATLDTYPLAAPAQHIVSRLQTMSDANTRRDRSRGCPAKHTKRPISSRLLPPSSANRFPP